MSNNTWGASNESTHDTSMSNNGGGYMNESMNTSTVQTGDQGDKKRGSNLIPVMIGHLKRPLQNLNLYGESVNMVTFVAIVRACNTDSLKTTYLLEDETGVINGINWKNQDEVEIKIPLNTYVRVLGLPREAKNEQSVMIVKMFPITELNEIPNHLLEVTYIMLKARSMKEGNTSGSQVAAGGGVDNSGNASSSNFAPNETGTTAANGSTTDENDPAHGLTPDKAMIYYIIKAKNDDDNGIERSQIKVQASDNVRPHVDSILEFLSSEGHVYTTCSEDYFKAT